MATKTTAGTLFPAELITEVFSAVQGRSALAKLSAQRPIPFNGQAEMVFSMAGEASIVGEGENKPAGDATVTSKVIKPLKFVYQHRVSDEFVYGAEEARISILQGFGEGFAKKIARGFDIAAMHGVNPADLSDASFKATNSFDGVITNTVDYAAATVDENIEDAIGAVRGAGREVTGIALSPAAGTALGKVKANGVAQYPEFRMGQNPDSFYGMGVDVNPTVAIKAVDEGLVGDFANAFRWGYAKEIPLEVIEYGDPDGQGDLKRTNEVVLRAEAYIGWGILDADSFARIVAAE